MINRIILLYSQADEIWQTRLEKHIQVLINSGYNLETDPWNETRIDASGDWYKEFEFSLNRPGAIILLASKFLFDTGFMQSAKVRNRLKAKQEGGFPIYILRIDDFKWGRFSWLKTLPILPMGGKLLPDLSAASIDSVLNSLVEQIEETLELAPPVNEGILSYLQLNSIGPFKQLIFEPGQRLNIITGDNGLGKTFLLECAWWALSGLWPQNPVYPRKDAGKDEVKISFQYKTKSGNKGKIKMIPFDWEKTQWPKIHDIASSSGLVIYARVDGAFAVWDPIRGKIPPNVPFREPLSPLYFDTKQILEGIKEQIPGREDRLLSNGLLLDWINWQRTPGSPFAVFEKILEKLSSTSLETLKPGEVMALPGRGTRDYPSLRYPFGNVPFILAAASVQRIISLAYFILWTWEEHKRACIEVRKTRYKNMIILVDEVESHLHPQWQRSIIPSLLEVQKYLDDELDIQFLVTTHSPMILSSIEPVFEDEQDKLFHLEDSFDDIELKKQPFLRRGRVDNWFTSETFGLFQARSREGETAIRDAQNLQQKKNPIPDEIKEVHERLIRYLGDNDTFWPRWIYFAKQHGVEV
jgi:hypothetical protein